MRGKRQTRRPDPSTDPSGPSEVPNPNALPPAAAEALRRLPPITEEAAARVAAAYDRTRERLAAEELAHDDEG